MKPPFFQDIHPCRNSVKKTEHFNVVLLNFCIYLTIVNKC